jgi:hypothetical protein
VLDSVSVLRHYGLTKELRKVSSDRLWAPTSVVPEPPLPETLSYLPAGKQPTLLQVHGRHPTVYLRAQGLRGAVPLCVEAIETALRRAQPRAAGASHHVLQRRLAEGLQEVHWK